MKKSILLMPTVVLSMVMGITLSSYSSTSVGSNDVTMDMSVLKSKDTTVYDVVDEIPSFPGGNSALMSYFSKKVKLPIDSIDFVPSRVIMRFIVERDGSLSNINVKAADARVVKEYLQALKEMPHWTPGKLHGKAVRVRYTIPLTMCLR